METWIVLCIESPIDRHKTPCMCFSNNDQWSYGLFKSREDAQRAADWIKKTYRGVYVVARYKLDEDKDEV
jgi:hypothetical protein